MYFMCHKLKAFHGVLPQAMHIPRWMQGKHIDHVMIPTFVIYKKVVKFQNHAQLQYLVQWVGRSPDDATWVPAETFELKYPDFVMQDVPVG